MGCPKGQLVWYVVLAPLLLVCACNQSPRSLPVSEQPQYELGNDAQGHVIRMNKATGERAIVTGEKLIPLGPTDQKLSPGSATPMVGPPARSAPTKAPQPSRAEESSARYELQKDPDGRVIRLNIVTGEMAIVRGTTVIPLELSTKSAALTTSPATRAPSRPGPERATSTSAPSAVLQEAIFTSAPRKQSIGSGIRITTTCGVFLIPDASRTPLRVLAAGSAANLLGTADDWYQIEFEDPRWGPRVGFVQKKWAARYDNDLEPIDLSIRKPKAAATEATNLPGKPKPSETEPVDLPIPSLKAAEQEPVDLSIDTPKPTATEPVDLSIRKPK